MSQIDAIFYFFFRLNEMSLRLYHGKGQTKGSLGNELDKASEEEVEDLFGQQNKVETEYGS